MAISAVSVGAGDLSCYVMVQQRTQTHDGTYQAQAVTWSDIKGVYADIEAVYGREQQAMRGTASEVSHMITVNADVIWANPKAAAEYRIVYRNRIFEIQGVMPEDSFNAIVTILALEGGADAANP